MNGTQDLTISPWAVTTILTLLGILFGAGFFGKMIWRAAISGVLDATGKQFESRHDAEKKYDRLCNRIQQVELKADATDEFVQTKLVSALEKMTVTLTRLETLHEERHRSTEKTLHEIRDELRKRNNP